MKKSALLFAIFGLMLSIETTGEPAMTQPNTPAARDALEKFNRPKDFLVVRSTFDIAAFKRNSEESGDYTYVRKDGVHVRQIDFDDDGYKEELTRPDSHYMYEYSYDRKGRLDGMSVRFCNSVVGEVLDFDEKGNIVKRSNVDIEGPFLAVEKLREQFLKETGVDIYDTEKVFYVQHSKLIRSNEVYFVIYVPKDLRGRLTAYLLDGPTGEILFKADAFRGPGGIESSLYKDYKAHLQAHGKKR
ncbi:MAG: hypothetical protein LBR95_10155 [Azoarcus sp.]|jgi:hypothetical protein|nr:hypothetical protein [Azoarcus sp.]